MLAEQIELWSLLEAGVWSLALLRCGPAAARAAARGKAGRKE